MTSLHQLKMRPFGALGGAPHHGLEESGGPSASLGTFGGRALVMELVEGPTLAERLAGAPVGARQLTGRDRRPGSGDAAAAQPGGPRFDRGGAERRYSTPSVLCSRQYGRQEQTLLRRQPENPPRVCSRRERGPDLPRSAVQLQRHLSVTRRMLRKRSAKSPPPRSRPLMTPGSLFCSRDVKMLAAHVRNT